VASEGLYNIQILNYSISKIDVDEDSMFHEYNDEMKKTQKKWTSDGRLY